MRDAGEGKLQVEMTDLYQRQVKEQTVQEAIRTLERRVNALGVAEPVIAATGSRGDQILVQLPGVTDVEQAKRVIKTTAQLSLRLVETSAATQETLLQGVGGKVPDNMEMVSGPGDTPGQPAYYLLRKEALITGRDLKSARVGVDENNRPQINFALNATAADKFSRETGRNIGRQLAILLDGTVYSAPVIQSKLGADNRITGRFTTQEADELSKILKAGALPATLKYLQELTVGASLGRDSIRDGVRGLDRGHGLHHDLHARLLPPLRPQRDRGPRRQPPDRARGHGLHQRHPHPARHRRHHPHRRAWASTPTCSSSSASARSSATARPCARPSQNGFERVWITILDTHATALIAAAFLFQFGTGPIKGFAVTLVIGLVSNVFASYFVSKFIFEWVLGKSHVENLSI